MTNPTISELKTACYSLADEAPARSVAQRIAAELSKDADIQYTLSHKCVWQDTHAHLLSESAKKAAAEKAAEPVTFAQICAAAEREENFALAALLASIWLLSLWLDLLLWLAPRAIKVGQTARQWATAAANAYTRLSYRITHGQRFPNLLSNTPDVAEAVERMQRALPSLYTEFKWEVVACAKYSREFYLNAAIWLLYSSLKGSGSATATKTATA